MNHEQKRILLGKLPYKEKIIASLVPIMEKYPTILRKSGPILETFETLKSEWGFKNPRLTVLTLKTFVVIDSGSSLKRHFA